MTGTAGHDLDQLLAVWAQTHRLALPGQKLPILDDPDFEDWVYETDPDHDVLVECFADYW